MLLKTECPAQVQGQSLDCNKDSKHISKGQVPTVYRSLLERPKTMLEVSVETGILRANICRYIASMRKTDRVAVVRHGLCPITGFEAGFYTTNKELFPTTPAQPTLFGKEEDAA